MGTGEIRRSIFVWVSTQRSAAFWGVRFVYANAQRHAVRIDDLDVQFALASFFVSVGIRSLGGGYLMNFGSALFKGGATRIVNDIDVDFSGDVSRGDAKPRRS